MRVFQAPEDKHEGPKDACGLGADKKQPINSQGDSQKFSLLIPMDSKLYNLAYTRT